MKSDVKIIKAKLTPTQQAIYSEIEELYEEGNQYFRDSNSYLLWHLLFYGAAIITLIMDLYLPSGFAFVVAIFCLILHIRYRSKAKRIAHKIFHLEQDLFEYALLQAKKAFEETVNGKDEDVATK